MEINKNLRTQKTNFCSSRNTEMTDEEFAILLITLPSFLVANADQDFDQDERDLMVNLLYNFLHEIYKQELNKEQYENMISCYIDDFLWINEHAEWKHKLISSLKLLSKDVDGLQNTVQTMMREMAEASEGESQEEAEVIADIISRLDQEDNIDELGL